MKSLSEQVGCSVAYLSRIERGDARISVDLLTKIGLALNVDPRWFFPSRTGKGVLERTCVVRADARRQLSGLYTRKADELGFTDELVSSTLAGQFYMIISKFPPKRETRQEPLQGYIFEGEQHGIVIQGRVKMNLNDEVIVLETGDSFSYSSMIPHRFYNDEAEEAVVVWAMAPVRITW